MCVQECVCVFVRVSIFSVAAAKPKFAAVQRKPQWGLHQAAGLIRCTFPQRKSLKTPQHAAICLSTCSPPLDSCHTLPWRPQGWSKGDILPAITMSPLLVRHYYSPERRKYEHLCDLKQNLRSSDRFIKSTMHLPFKSLFYAKKQQNI